MEKVSCPDCGRMVLRKNLKKHYLRNHPGADPRKRLRESRKEGRKPRIPHFDIKTPFIVPVMITLLVILILLIATLAFYSLTKEDEEVPEARNIFYAASDGVVINGTYYSCGVGDQPTIFLIHDLGSDRTVWGNFPLKLRNRNYNVLAIDLRGNGESVNSLTSDKKLDWTEMSDSDLYNIVRDIEAGAKWVRGKNNEGVPNTDASIDAALVGIGKGGQFALAQASLMSRPDPKTLRFMSAVLISPTLNDRGLDIEQIAENWGDVRPIMFAGSEGDGNSVTAVKALMERRPENGISVMIDTTKTGIDLLNYGEVRDDMYDTIEWGFERT